MTGNKHRSAYIEQSNNQYDRLFQQRGWRVVADIEKADMVQFTGGADVDPHLYNQHPHPTTRFNRRRDQREQELFVFAQQNNIPCSGICRGSQFLHVMSGGHLIQHCDNHAVGRGHSVKVAWMPGEVLVSSTHHQMMSDADVGEVLVYTNLATTKQGMDEKGVMLNCDTGFDIEGMYYPETNSLSYQPHPEFSVDDKQYEECADVYFFMIENYLFGDA